MPRHVALVLPDLGGGGAERLTLDLARGFVERGARVDLVVMAARGEFVAFVPEGVRLVDLAAERLRGAVWPLRQYLKREKPDAVLAAMWPLTVVAILAVAGLPQRPRVVVSDHCALIDQYAASPRASLFLRASIRASYRFADAVVAVSDGLSTELAGLAGLPVSRVRTIVNPIPPPALSGIVPDWPASLGRRVLSVGKLKGAKNFPLLIEAFAQLETTDEAVLAIVGEGAERERLEARIARLGLRERVILPGFTATPGDWYASADLFVLPSDYEGFGNVLVEAMHCGLPVVATDCPHGPAEVLGRGEWGRLVPVGDAAALARAITAALAEPADAASQRVRAQEFSVERAVAAYWDALAA